MNDLKSYRFNVVTNLKKHPKSININYNLNITMKTPFFLVAILVANLVLGQTSKNTIIYFNDTIPASIINLKETKGFAYNTFKSEGLNLSGYNTVTTLNTTNPYIKADTSYPDYIVELEFVNRPTQVFVFDIVDSETKKKSKSIFIISSVEGEMYISDRNKGLIKKQRIVLKKSTRNLKYSSDHVSKYRYDMTLNGSDYSNTILAIKGVSETALSKYVKSDGNGGWIAKKEFVAKVNNIQAHKLFVHCNNRTITSFQNTIRSNSYYSNYIKKWKNNEVLMNEYNGIIKSIENDIKENNLKNIGSKAEQFKSILSKLDTNEKKQKKLYIRTLKNIALVQFFSKKYNEALQTINEVRNFKGEDSTLEYLRKRIEAKSKKRVEKEITYKELPQKLVYTRSLKLKQKDNISDVVGAVYYENHIISNVVMLFNLHKATNKVYSEKLTEKGLFGLKTFVYTKLKGLRNNNLFYKKQNPEFYSKLKAIKKDMAGTGKYDDKINAFFKTYSFEFLHEFIQKPIFDKLYDTYNLDENEKIVFNALVESYANLNLIMRIGNSVKIAEYENVSRDFKAALIKHIEKKGFTIPIEAEILVGLNLVPTQELASQLNIKQKLNFMKILFVYASGMSL